MSTEAATQIKEKPRATHEIPTDLNHDVWGLSHHASPNRN
jgi:hypothetical protein